MREISCGSSGAQSEGQIDNGDAARQHPFHAILAVMDKMEEHMRRNNDLLQKMGLKMDSLTEKVEKLERAYFRQEGANVADDSQSPPTYTGAEATDGPIFSSSNMEMHPLIPAIVTLSDLVREKRMPIEVKERKVVYLSTSTDEEVVLKEKSAEVLQDAMKPKLVPELQDESSAQQEKKCQQPQDFNPLSLGPPRPYRNRKLGWYQLFPYDQVSRGPKPKYRAGPFFMNEPVTLDQLKMLQYGFDKSASLDEIIVRSSHEDITRQGLLSLLPDASLDEEIIFMMSDYLTRRESCKSHGQPIS
ncbi:uncharacterized protein LOC127902775 isoform X2 [Citrus sinensis]|nr:uncharacterized protein LOC127902775 isoform X2 [Citrus sinensis]